jgi:hypothetical protein
VRTDVYSLACVLYEMLRRAAAPRPAQGVPGSAGLTRRCGSTVPAGGGAGLARCARSGARRRSSERSGELDEFTSSGPSGRVGLGGQRCSSGAELVRLGLPSEQPLEHCRPSGMTSSTGRTGSALSAPSLRSCGDRVGGHRDLRFTSRHSAAWRPARPAGAGH